MPAISDRSRILDSKDWIGTVLIFGLGSAAIVSVGMSAYYGSRFSAVCLIFISLLWLGSSVATGRAWRRTIGRWSMTLDSWGETTELVNDIASLLNEACNGLATYDREAADEIIQRGTTIMLMRQQNIISKTKGG